MRKILDTLKDSEVVNVIVVIVSFVLATCVAAAGVLLLTTKSGQYYYLQFVLYVNSHPYQTLIPVLLVMVPLWVRILFKEFIIPRRQIRQILDAKYSAQAPILSRSPRPVASKRPDLSSNQATSESGTSSDMLLLALLASQSNIGSGSTNSHQTEPMTGHGSIGASGDWSSSPSNDSCSSSDNDSSSSDSGSCGGGD